MKEPLSLRISDASDPKRGEKFERVLTKRRANAADVMRGLVDAYIESDGAPGAPWLLREAPAPAHYGKRRGKV